MYKYTETMHELNSSKIQYVYRYTYKLVPNMKVLNIFTTPIPRSSIKNNIYFSKHC
jgi:hypothetical protein